MISGMIGTHEDMRMQSEILSVTMNVSSLQAVASTPHPY